MVSKGATTSWERWDTDTQDGGMNGESQKILSGNFEAWCYQTLGGINYDPEQPGFKHILLRPCPVGDLRWVRAAHTSMYGKIEKRLEDQRRSPALEGRRAPWHDRDRRRSDSSARLGQRIGAADRPRKGYPENWAIRRHRIPRNRIG